MSPSLPGEIAESAMVKVWDSQDKGFRTTEVCNRRKRGRETVRDVELHELSLYGGGGEGNKRD